jgi:hypothetical protein
MPQPFVIIGNVVFASDPHKRAIANFRNKPDNQDRQKCQNTNQP